MPRYKLEIEYIGREFSGSQTQTEGIRTVQSEVQKAISTLIKQNTKTIFSGRTDSGVSAKGQVIHFDYDKSIVASRFVNSINGLLPKDVSVKSLEEVEPRFHAQLSAKWRWYRYSIINRNHRSVFDGNSLLVREELNLENLKCALHFLEGENDFSSFKSTGTTTPSDVCNIFYTQVEKRGDEIIIDIVGNRFLYNMVRIIVGTLLMMEKNSLAPNHIENVLKSKDRKQAGPTIAPYGLTLMKVGYKPFGEEAVETDFNSTVEPPLKKKALKLNFNSKDVPPLKKRKKKKDIKLIKTEIRL